MREVNRIDLILQNLNVLWNSYPDMRLCQLLHTMAMKSGWNNDDLFHIEDDIIDSQIQKEIMRMEGLVND